MDSLIHELFEQQVLRTPEAIAAVCGTQRLTYAELNGQANRIATKLRELGVGPDQLVAVCTERSLELVVGVLAVLKAGGAYVPLDPAYPLDRLRYMLEDASPKVLLAQAALQERLPGTSAAVVTLGLDDELLGRSSEDLYRIAPNLACESHRAQQLAYVIYTSGSTGIPKGVMIEHRNVTRLFSATRPWFGFNEHDVWTLFHSFAFDFSVWELWGALLYGGRLVVVPYLVTRSPAEFLRLLCEERVTVLNQTPSAFSQLIDAQARDSRLQHSLRTVIFGGEALEFRTLRPWVRENGIDQPELVNMYGITETTVHVTYHRLSRREIESERGSLIGEAIPDLQLYLLDSQGRPVEKGETGELYVGGAGVARGYLNRPELTSERFIRNPFDLDPSARLYKTGDLGRRREDGALEYLGRNDHQVKIRGYRIELGEIEAQLASHPRVKDAIVLAREDSTGDKRLVGYVTSDLLQSFETPQNTDPAIAAEIVGQWQSLYEETYTEETSSPTFIGWNSSYTDRPIPQDHMQEWLDNTLQRIRALRPRRVLEIGCGVGLLLAQLAPDCELYRGTDFSSEAIERIRSWTSKRPEFRSVELQQCAALDLQAPATPLYDTIILNSVVQYFPDIRYLRTVLERAAGWLVPGGHIFVGDVRHLGLWRVFHSSIQVQRAAADVSVATLRSRVARAMELEKELLIDPRFFATLAEDVADIGGVEVLLKRGRSDNELTRYRYDVVLTIGETRASHQGRVVDWALEKRGAAGIERLLSKLRGSDLLIQGVSNRRLQWDLAVTRQLDKAADADTAGSLRDAVGNHLDEAEDPEDFWQLGSHSGREVHVRWTAGDEEGRFDVEFVDIEKAAQSPPKPSQGQPIEKSAARDAEYANNPSARPLKQRLILELREYLEAKLPQHMVPGALVVMERFPLTPNGKLDRGALPAPKLNAYASREYEAPQGQVEPYLAEIWQDVLRVERVGRQDNFFELGGHSLLIVQMMERVRRLGLDCDVRSVFEHPTLAALANALEKFSGTTEIPPNRIPSGTTALAPDMLPLVDLTAKQLEHLIGEVPGGAANIQDIYPLAPLQHGMLLHSLLNERTGDTYVLHVLFSLPSPEKLAEFVRGLGQVVSRHDVLRTSVHWEQLPQPVQVVSRHASLAVCPLTLDPERDAVEQLEELMKPGEQRLDLHQAPLMRLQTALEPRSDTCYAVLQFHHLMQDNTSLHIMLAEVLTHVAGRAGSLPDPVPYRNHIAQILAYSHRNEAESFFRNKLGTLAEPTAPFGILDIRGDGNQVREAHCSLEPALATRIRTQAARLGVSPATLFHAAWALIVARTSAREEAVFGTVLLGRLQGNAGAQRMLGMFINMLPLRITLNGVTVRSLIEQTRRELIEILAHEQAPLEVARRSTDLDGSAPLFTTVLNYRHSTEHADLEGLEAETAITVLKIKERTNYPIYLSIDDRTEGFSLTAQTGQGLDPQRIAAYVATAVDSLTAALEIAPDAPALQLSIVPEAERRVLIEAFNSTRASYPGELLIHDLFENQVRRKPQGTAVITETRSATFAEINETANQLARYLKVRGVGPDKLVAVCMERSIDLIVGLLGVLKAGGAYVPLDPAYPAQRLQYMLEDSKPLLLLTHEPARNRLPEVLPEVISIDSSWARIAEHEKTDLSPAQRDVRPHHLAYVIYTSGSTGLPKGAMNEHRGMVNRILAQEHMEQFVESDVCSQKTSISFVDAVFETFGALCNGRPLVIIPQDAVVNSAEMAAMIARHQVTQLTTVPSLALSMLGNPRVMRNLAGLRNWTLSGEEVRPDLLAQLQEKLPDCEFIILYGASEVSSDASFHKTRVAQGTRVPIGRPVPNAQVYVLDPRNEPVAIGAVGEIHVGGVGVGRGYLNRPELTAERFVRDPFSSDPLARLYKTGDLGRWREDGTLECLGRADHQVKIRGFRIELGEIETRLLQHPRVRQAVVIAREDPGEKRLVAYITPRNEAYPSVAELRTHVQAALPDYMVPSAIVTLDRLPTTPNGKLDRRALPTPDRQAYCGRDYEPPRGGAEEVLAGIWQRLLKIERIGRHDSFFDLGGHSLLILQMIESLSRHGLKSETRRLFDNTTLAELAASLSREAITEETPPNLIPPDCESIEPGMLPMLTLNAREIRLIEQAVPGGAANIQDIYPLAPLQEGILFHYLAGQTRADSYLIQTLLAVPSRERLEELIAALQHVIDRHDVLRTSVLWEGLPQPVQVVYRNATVPVEELLLERQRTLDEQFADWLNPERQRLDLRTAPLIRLQTAADPHSQQWFVLLQIHHIVNDATSMRSVIDEVAAYLDGRTQQLPAPLPYRNYVAQALSYMRSHDPGKFFRTKLADVTEVTAPFGLMDIHGGSGHLHEAQQPLDPHLAKRVRLQARRLEVSAATLFHAVWAIVVARTSGRDDVVYGTVLLGGSQSDEEARRMLGLFVNTLPLRLHLREANVRELVDQTQRELADLLTHRQASLAVAQRCTSISGSGPLFTTLLNYRHLAGPKEAWAVTGMRELLAREQTHYPIVLSVNDAGEDFQIIAQTDLSIDPSRLTQYVLRTMQSLLDVLDETSSKPALQLTMIPDAEHRLLNSFNATWAFFSKHARVQDLFEAQVRRTSTRPAVIHGRQALTYAQLDARANQLARHLRDRGVRPGQPVGICMERNLQMVIGLLAILKAGGAYLPLDPNYPAERLAYIFGDAAPRVLLTQEHSYENLPDTAAEVLWLDAGQDALASYSEESIPANEFDQSPDDLVYIIYTSGSTGRPKGIEMPHSAMSNLIEWHRNSFGPGQGRRVLQFAALSFDVAFQETFTTLCTGDTLLLLDERVRKDPRALLRFLKEERIERLFLPPLMLQALAECAIAEDIRPRALRAVITAGEQLRVTPQVVDFLQKLDHCELHNHYGPTETHVVTAMTLSGNPAHWPALPTIGRPIANTRIHILDSHLQATPVGVPGEIHIAGTAVARGYRGRPEMTAERFIRDPFSSDPRARMYKTGDLGRWQADGSIEYLGRNDDQVKIRGFRIEPDEIATQLTTHSEVKDAVVVAREDVPGEKRLVAYVTARDGSQPDPQSLRTFLQRSLPEYMVPAAFVILPSLPVSPNGKLDRRALPPPDLQASAQRFYEPPQNDIEEVLADIWRNILHIDRVGRFDNFFELGGHSLHAMRLIASVGARLRVELPIMTVFQHSTIAQLAEQVVSCTPVDTDTFDEQEQEEHIL